jgi:hypothetical protein
MFSKMFPQAACAAGSLVEEKVQGGIIHWGKRRIVHRVCTGNAETG